MKQGNSNKRDKITITRKEKYVSSLIAKLNLKMITTRQVVLSKNKYDLSKIADVSFHSVRAICFLEGTGRHFLMNA